MCAKDIGSRDPSQNIWVGEGRAAAIECGNIGMVVMVWVRGNDGGDGDACGRVVMVLVVTVWVWWWWWWWCVTRMVMVMVVVVVMVVVWEGIGLCTSLCVFDAWHAC